MTTHKEQARRAAQAKHADKMQAAEPEARSAGRELLSAEDLWAFGVTFSKVHLWQQVKRGLFPAPIKLSANRNAWIRGEVEAWVEARKRERDAAIS